MAPLKGRLAMDEVERLDRSPAQLKVLNANSTLWINFTATVLWLIIKIKISSIPISR